MKKRFLFVLSLFIVVSLLLTSALSEVQAYFYTPPTPQDPAEGNWQFDGDLEAESVHMKDLMASAPPAEWMRLMSNGLHLQTVGATTLCHPFPGAQDGWEGAIYLQNGSSWLALASTTAWMPDEEGSLMTCAQAPMTGVYALFGYCGEDCQITGPVRAVAVNLVDVVMELPEAQFSVE
jgi:hypothetical protein